MKSNDFQRKVLLIVAGLILSVGGRAIAGGGPEGVVVVVNEDSWASLAVANEFVHLRKIPQNNVIYLKGGTNWAFDSIDIEGFRKYILLPVLEAIKKRNLHAQVDCIVYSADVPYRIRLDKDLPGGKARKPLTSSASINSMTYMYRWVLPKQPGDPSKRTIGYLSLRNNWYARRRVRFVPAPKPLTPEQTQSVRQANTLISQKKWVQAEKGYRQIIKDCPKNFDVLYNLACCLARLGKLDEAMVELTKSVRAGWYKRKHMEKDEDFKSLRERKDFKELLKQVRPLKVGVQLPRGFSSRYGWTPTGQIFTTGATGPRQGYVLSTVLAVTSGRGTSLGEAIRCLRRSAAADGTHPKGTIYYMVNKDVRSRTRQWGFDSVIAKLKALGVKAEAVKGTMPKNRKDVMGLAAGSARFDWSKTGCSILPGAICEHLTSHGGGMYQRSNQTACTEFIRAGAAGTCGTVTEPYAIQAKFPTPFMHYFYASGCSLAEAFYQSVSGPYQLLIIGDPLCRPWAKIPTVTLSGVKPGQVVKDEMTLTPGVKEKDIKIGRYELFIDGLRQAARPPGESFTIDTAGLSDGWHEIRIVAVTADMVATQGNTIVGITIDNHGQKIDARCALALNVVPLGAKVPFSVKLPGAKKIGIFHNSRELATVAGAAGIIKIDTCRLGLGTVNLRAVGTIETDGNTVSVASSPLQLTIEPPARLKGVKPPKGKPITKGLKLTTKGGKPFLVKDMRNMKALTDAGVKKGQAFRLEGYFDVPADDIYQFQVKFDGEMTIEVDGKVFDVPAGRQWKYLPVSLARGTHRFRAKGKANSLRIDIRFGGPGAFSLSEKRFGFRYVGKPPTTMPQSRPTEKR
jgi:hypothetical protein